MIHRNYQREIVIPIKNNEYKVSFPKTGQSIRIEVLKADLSKGYYNALSTTTGDAYYAKMLIDTIATFSVLIPTLKKDLNVDDILELELIDSKILLNAYLKVFLPWYDQWMNIITAVEEKVSTEVEE